MIDSLMMAIPVVKLSTIFSGQTLLHLVQDFAPGTQIFFDNYFSSPALLLALK